MSYYIRSSGSAFDIATNITLLLDPSDFKYIPLIQRRLIGRVVKPGVVQWRLFGKDLRIEIISVDGSSDPLTKKVDRATHFELEKVVSTPKEQPQDIYITALKDTLSNSFENSNAFDQLHIPVTKSILIHGVPGVGKTRLVEQVAALLSCTVYTISAYELVSYDEEEYECPEFFNYNPLTLYINKALTTGPSIVVIDDLDALSVKNDKSKKIVQVIEKQVDRIASEAVCLIGMAHELGYLPESLKKTDIFRQHMTLPIPSVHQRKEILQSILRDIQSSPMDDYASQLSMRTSGYVARDLKQLVRQAQLKSKRGDIVNQLEHLSLEGSRVQWSDFEYALDTYRPSQRTEVESTLPKRDWSELGGYSHIKEKMRQSVLLPLSQPHVFTRLGIKPPSGLLLYGPSGCGKTAFVQALVSESMMNVISIKGPEIFSKYLGETENKIRRIFATAKRIAPCIVFIDEMDAIGTKRGFDMGESGGGVNERVLSTLLNEMDGVEGRQGVVVIGCTNRPDQIDDAILRPGRLDQLVYLGLPTKEDRKEIIQALVNRIRVANDVIPDRLAEETEFCTGADLENLFREAGTMALRQDMNIDCIQYSHIQSVLVPICERAEDQILEGRLDLYEKFLHDHTL